MQITESTATHLNMKHIWLNLTLLEKSLPLQRTIVTYAGKYNDNGTRKEA